MHFKTDIPDGQVPNSPAHTYITVTGKKKPMSIYVSMDLYRVCQGMAVFHCPGSNIPDVSLIIYIYVYIERILVVGIPLCYCGYTNVFQFNQNLYIVENTAIIITEQFPFQQKQAYKGNF